jgi:dTDP-4-amino-4,6-dideoxygalactose transaminase
MIQRRREVASRYAEALSGVEGVDVPFSPDHSPHTYQSYMIALSPRVGLAREELMQKLLGVGIATRRGVMAIHMEPLYRERFPQVRLPVTESATRRTLLLPLYATMTDTEQQYVLEHLLSSLKM